MIIYNGWIAIQMNVDCDLDSIDGSDLKAFFSNMEPFISDFNKYPSRSAIYKSMNWDDIYLVNGIHNRVLSYLDDVVTLYKTIGEKAPGSFGLLYVRLPEDPVHWNNYRVFRLAKGVLTEHEDTLLSPCRPVVEI